MRLSAVLATMLVPLAAHADVLPLCSRSAFSLVIDRSGSMTGQKIYVAKAAATAVVDKLGPNDCVGVIAFDSAPTTVVAMHPLSDPAVVKAAIARISAGGGTDILPALDAAHKTLLGVTSPKKHVILLTDGQSPVAGMQTLAQTMNTEHMTLSTVGFGADVDEQTLKMLASTASGTYFHVMDPTSLTTVFTRDVDHVLTP